MVLLEPCNGVADGSPEFGGLAVISVLENGLQGAEELHRGGAPVCVHHVDKTRMLCYARA